MLLDDLQTPCVLIEQHRLEQNLRRMQGKARANGVSLRPHVKTHKSLQIARRQQELGAAGITVATVHEAEVFANGGFEDACIAFTLVGRDKLERAAALARRIALSFCVDSRVGARAASEVFAARGLTANVLIEVDTGHHRTGVPWDGNEAVDLAAYVREQPGLRLAGLLTHAGQAYHGPENGESAAEALVRHAVEERNRILSVAARVSASDEQLTISIGSTPTMAAFENAEVDGRRITEIRPGNYVFCDAMQVALGSAALTDCALTVLATVVSKHRDRDGSERVFIDAGKKILTSDTGAGTVGYGVVLYNAHTMTPLPHVRIESLSEEHGWIRVHGGSTLGIGDRVRIVPNHACVVVATQSQLHLVGDEEVIGAFPVDAR